MSKKISIFIDHDIIFRNFVFNGAFEEISKNNKLTYIFPEHDNKRFKIKVENYLKDFDVVRIPENGKRKLIWRYLCFLENFKLSSDEQLQNLKRLRKLTLGWKASFIFSIIALPIIRQCFHFIFHLILKNNKFIELEEYCQTYKPDLIIHPTVLDGIYCNDLGLVGNKYGIKTIFIMNSWDNPSTKSYMINHPNYLLVWGPQTKNHAIEYLKMKENRIIEFGVNQFDPIKKIKIKKLEKKRFKKISNQILFAGSNAQVDEYNFLNKIDILILDWKLNLKFNYRPHPWSGGGHDGYKIMQNNWKNIEIDPNSIEYLNAVKKDFIPISLPQQNETYLILNETSITISPLSTIILETILSGRVAIVYIPLDKKSFYINKILKRFIHFEELLRSEVLPICHTPEDVLDKCIYFQSFQNYKDCYEKQQLYLPNLIKDFEKKWPVRFSSFVNSI